MKYRFYVDILPGANPGQFGLHASTNPAAKCKDFKRIAFDVQIPDEWMFHIDAVSPEVSVPRLVADHDDDA
jgi:hypothetical protein